MLDATNSMVAATLAFAGGHFLLSAKPLRPLLVQRFGAQGFRLVYSTVMVGAFIWMLLSYRSAPFLAVWTPAAALAWVPLLVMPFAAILLVAGLTTPGPTLVGGERFLDGTPGSPAVGILSITRHPFLWGTGLWALSHLLANGDFASMVLMGGIAVLSFGGMRHIDQRREASLGAAWGPMKLTTSVLPFAAALGGRSPVDWRGIGWWRPLLGLAVYAALLHLHSGLIGVSPLPF
ncbi:NnrU family protein [Pelagibius marinus]|uniref:NnrU family protein n=1 Tax=Pelagibius marinus TaxID=2762760 RepID=UPI00187272D4|nr:NnrU family protein [Pelagibius marinus]